MAKKINLDKAYVYQGTIIGPGEVDVEAKLRDAGLPPETVDKAVSDLQAKVEAARKEAAGEDVAADGSATSVTRGRRGTDADVTQDAPKEATDPKTSPHRR